MDSRSDTNKAILLSVLAFVAFSLSDGIRKIWSVHYDVIDILFWQGIFGFIVILCLTPLMGGLNGLIDPKNSKWHVARGVLMALNTVLSLSAISQIPIMDAYTIFFLTPFVLSLLGVVFFKEQIGKYRFISICLGFFGAFVAFRPGFIELNSAYLFALSATVTFSLSGIISRFLGRANGLLSYGFWPFLILVSGILIYKGGDIYYSDDPMFYIYMAVAGSSYVFALLTVSYSYTLAPVAVVAPYQYTQIIFALGFGYLFFGTVPDIYKILGSAIIVGSGIWLFARERALRRRK